MVPQLLVLVVFPLLLAAAACWDITSYTIPNLLQVGLLLVFAIYAYTTAMPVPVLGWHLATGLGGLVVGFSLFAFGVIGGGDAKLFTCVATMFGFHDIFEYTIVATILGGGLTLGLLALRQLPLPASLACDSWIARLHNPEEGVPYGVALAAGAVLILPHSEIFRIAALG